MNDIEAIVPMFIGMLSPRLVFFPTPFMSSTAFTKNERLQSYIASQYRNGVALAESPRLFESQKGMQDGISGESCLFDVPEDVQTIIRNARWYFFSEDILYRTYRPLGNLSKPMSPNSK